MPEPKLTGMALLRSKRGALSSVARALGISRGATSQWRDVPAESVVRIEEVTGLRREELRPDLYRSDAA